MTDTDSVSHRFSRTTIQAGFVGGAFATLTMTLFRAPTARSLPPPAEFLSQVFGGDPDEYHLTSLVLHFIYGIIGGAVFGPLSATAISETNEPETVGLVLGAIYGGVLSVFGERIVLRRVLEMDLSTDEKAVFHAGHVIYGLTLGTWIGSRS